MCLKISERPPRACKGATIRVKWEVLKHFDGGKLNKDTQINRTCFFTSDHFGLWKAYRNVLLPDSRGTVIGAFLICR